MLPSKPYKEVSLSSLSSYPGEGQCEMRASPTLSMHKGGDTEGQGSVYNRTHIHHRERRDSNNPKGTFLDRRREPEVPAGRACEFYIHNEG